MARSSFVLVICVLDIFIAGVSTTSFSQNPSELRGSWLIQSSSEVRADGAAISNVGFPTTNWYPAKVPSTVLSALVEDQVYPDPYTGMNLRSIPGTTYPIFEDFSNILMPPASPFRHSWWYRTEFNLPAEYIGKTIWLAFDGINYRANVWMNGKQIANFDQLSGTWRLFRFDVSATAQAGRANALAIEVFPPQPHDLAITLVDWAPMPPDKEMGVWRDVHISATGPVALRYPAVLTKLNLPTADQAKIDGASGTDERRRCPVEATVKGHIEDVAFEQTVRLGPRETQVVHFTPEGFPQLKLQNPRLWWPAQVGKQELYPLDLAVEVQGGISDEAHIQFGIRDISSKIDENGHRLFQINGKNILIRGAGYSFDLILRSSPEKQAELRYVRDLNLNAVRLEGKIENDHFFDLADRLGILVMPGWCCCDQWENWPTWDRKTNESRANRYEISCGDWRGTFGAGMALWKRFRSTASDRKSLSANHARSGVAKPCDFLRRRSQYNGRPERREDDRTL